METKLLGTISVDVASALGNSILAGMKVYLGEKNMEHMKNAHPDDYLKYEDYLPMIIESPDYVGINRKDNSIEFVKEFYINDDYVKVAVRASTSGIFYARSLYTLNRNRVDRFVENGTLIRMK